jgi:hypothetical protein
MIFGENTVYDVAADNLAAQNPTATADSPVIGMLQHVPGTAASTGMNAMRIGKTITSGGYNERRFMTRLGRYADGSAKVRGRILNHNPFNPRSWTRLSSSAQVHGAIGPDGKALYTPTNAISHGLNNLFARKSSVLEASEKTSSFMARGARNGIDWADDPFQAGALGKFNAMGRLNWSRRLSEKKAGNIMNYLKTNDSILHNFVDAMPEKSPFHFAGGGRDAVRQGQTMLSMAGDHTATNFMGGFRNAVHGGSADLGEAMVKHSERAAANAQKAMDLYGGLGHADGAKAARTTMEAFEKHAAGKRAWVKGAAKATEWLSHGGEEFAAKFAEKGGIRLLGKGMAAAMEKGGVSLAARVGAAGAARYATGALPVVGQALMAVQFAYDLTNMAMEGVKGVGKFTGDAVTSMKGSIDKPAMGMGFRDNEVTATSRARGVQAIQNSRLNARSVLGSEGAYLHARYG